MEQLTQRLARKIIEVVGSSGQPPEWGFQYFSAGLAPYLNVIEGDYLRSQILEGGSAFKMVIGVYGGGKTHFLYCIRELAWQHNYLVSYCPLTRDASPLHKMELVYRAIAANIMRPLTPDELLFGSERGLVAFLKSVYSELAQAIKSDDLSEEERRHIFQTMLADLVRGIEVPGFARAIRLAMEALDKNDMDEFDIMMQYLLIDGFDKNIFYPHGILRPIDQRQAFSCIRSLVSFIRNLRFRGLVVLLDEVEPVGALNSTQKEIMVTNLRELVDQCCTSDLANTMFFYAVPNENFLKEGRGDAYEALIERIKSVFDFVNPSGIRIKLDKLTNNPKSLLTEIGLKLADIYEIAYDCEFPLDLKRKVTHFIAEAASQRRLGDIGYKRIFVLAMVRALHTLRLSKVVNIDDDFGERMLDEPTEAEGDQDD